MIANISSFLKFEVNEINPDTKKIVSSYEDEYQLDDFELNLGDWVCEWAVGKGWMELWNVIEDQEEENYQLEAKTVETAIKGILKHFCRLALVSFLFI